MASQTSNTPRMPNSDSVTIVELESIVEPLRRRPIVKMQFNEVKMKLQYKLLNSRFGFYFVVVGDLVEYMRSPPFDVSIFANGLFPRYFNKRLMLLSSTFDALWFLFEPVLFLGRPYERRSYID